MSREGADGEDVWAVWGHLELVTSSHFLWDPAIQKPSVSVIPTTANTYMVPDMLPGPARVSAHLILMTAMRW